MWNRKIRKSTRLLVLALLFCLLSAFGTYSQAEMMYQISESELNQLEQNSRKQEENSLSNQKTLQEQKAQLKTANEKIQKSQTENEAMRNSFEKTQKYLDEYEKEAEHKIEVKTRQRDAWEAAAAILFGVLVKNEIVK